MSEQTVAAYQVDAHWKIVAVTDAFCRMTRCAESSLVGRDVRDLLRHDWRHDFQSYVARALVGAGDGELTVPLIAPGSAPGWFKHTVEPIAGGELLEGYRASIRPYVLARPAATRRWWQWRAATAPRVWDFELEQLTR